MSQYQKNMRDVINELPPIRELKTSSINNKNSCLISILGFEPRSFAVSEYFASQNEMFDKSICIKYIQKEMAPFNFKHEAKLSSLLKAITREDVECVEHDDHEFCEDFGDKIIEKLSNMGVDVGSNKTNILFDITVGSSRLLLEGLHALFQTKVSLTILYSESTLYRPFFSEYRSYVDDTKHKDMPAPEFLAYGVENIEIPKRISGHNADSCPTYLVVFPSFTPTRLGAVLEEMSPSRVYWLFGIPHLIENRWRLDAQIAYHKKMTEHLHRHCYVSTFDYKESLQVLTSIYNKIKADYNMLVCSLGSKLQKVGQVLFHLLRPEVGTVVSVPKLWDPKDYSDVLPRAIYSIQFQDCEELRNRLSQTKKLIL